MRNHHSIRIAVMVAVAVFVGAFTSECAHAGPPDWNSATIAAVTSFSGSELREMADAHSVDLQALPEKRRASMLDAIRSAVGGSLDYWKASLPDSAKLVIWIAPEFTLSLQADEFGTSKKLNLPVSALVAGLKPQPVFISNAAPPADPLPDPPAMADVMGLAPSDPQARGPWLRSKAFELLVPIGREWLARAEVPMPYSGLCEMAETPTSQLAPEQLAWLKTLYSRYAADMYAQQQVLRKFVKLRRKSGQSLTGPFSVYDTETGIQVNSADVLSYSPPLWDQFCNHVKVSLTVRYLLAVEAIPNPASGARSVGWRLD